MTSYAHFSISPCTSYLLSQLLSNRDDDGGESSGPFGFVGKFFEELDNFVDDATSRRLGGGAKFYGKRKSSFYGNSDEMKKMNSNVNDPTEDYQGPTNSGYFVWKKDEDTGRMTPKTRMKGKTIERNPSFWDKVYQNTDDDD